MAMPTKPKRQSNRRHARAVAAGMMIVETFESTYSRSHPVRVHIRFRSHFLLLTFRAYAEEREKSVLSSEGRQYDEAPSRTNGQGSATPSLFAKVPEPLDMRAMCMNKPNPITATPEPTIVALTLDLNGLFVSVSVDKPIENSP